MAEVRLPAVCEPIGSAVLDLPKNMTTAAMMITATIRRTTSLPLEPGAEADAARPRGQVHISEVEERDHAQDDQERDQESVDLLHQPPRTLRSLSLCRSSAQITTAATPMMIQIRGGAGAAWPAVSCLPVVPMGSD